MMSNEPIKPNGGMGSLLTTLASGDNVSKLLMVVLLVVQSGGIWNTSRNGSETRSEVDRAHEASVKQVGVIFRNQTTWGNYARATFKQNELIMEALHIPKDKWPPAPQFNIIEQLDTEPNY
jgi:hypothetical protein